MSAVTLVHLHMVSHDFHHAYLSCYDAFIVGLCFTFFTLQSAEVASFFPLDALRIFGGTILYVNGNPVQHHWSQQWHRCRSTPPISTSSISPLRLSEAWLLLEEQVPLRMRPFSPGKSVPRGCLRFPNPLIDLAKFLGSSKYDGTWAELRDMVSFEEAPMPDYYFFAESAWSIIELIFVQFLDQ